MAAIVKIGYNYNNDESPNNNEETKINLLYVEGSVCRWKYR